ncbi:Dbl homology domain-containing protein, partial [Patellaria atrata CBS 101060]
MTLTRNSQSRSLSPAARDSQISRPNSSLAQKSDQDLSLTQQSDEHKRLSKRQKIIGELVFTEHTFNQDMKVVQDIYMPTCVDIEEMKPEDRKVLFGNADEVQKFSQEFLHALKQAASSIYTLPKSSRFGVKRNSVSTSHSATTEQSVSSGTDIVDEQLDRQTTIGEVFAKHIPQMNKVYGDYIKNQLAASDRLKLIQERPAVKIWLGECQHWAKDITFAWNLDALLVKPTQRLSKYPLLLKDLQMNTAKDHPDYAAIELAVQQTMQVLQDINDSKKRAEVLDSVMNPNRKRKESDTKVPSGLAKAFGRRTEKLRQQVGLTEFVEDTEYIKHAQEFGKHAFELQVVMRDVEKYMEEVQIHVDRCNELMVGFQDWLNVSEGSDPEKASRWIRFARTIQELTATSLPEHKAAIRKSVVEPIGVLWKIYNGGPQKLMNKRKKRLADYSKLKTLKERGESVPAKIKDAGEVYVALNEALKIELPALYKLSKELVENCMRIFIQIQSNWHKTWEMKIKAMMQEQLSDRRLSHEKSDIIADFKADFQIIENDVQNLSICNRSQLEKFYQMASPTFITDGSSLKRPSTMTGSSRVNSMNSD